jgi:hypothetical protein
MVSVWVLDCRSWFSLTYQSYHENDVFAVSQTRELHLQFQGTTTLSINTKLPSIAYVLSSEMSFAVHGYCHVQDRPAQRENVAHALGSQRSANPTSSRYL